MSALLIPLMISVASRGDLSINYENLTNVQNAFTGQQNWQLPAGYVAFPEVGYAYKFFKTKLTWNGARKQCIAEGATLVIVDSFTKVQNLMSMPEVRVSGIYTGIHRSYDGVEWTSLTTGKPPTFIPWKPDANLAAGTGNCGAMWYDGTGMGPYICSNLLPSVCEIPIFRQHRSEAQISLGPITAVTPN